jgi:hypothetical protein
VNDAYRKFGAPRVVRCPITGGVSAVEIDPAHAALTMVMGKRPLRVGSCPLWPRCRGCGSACLREMDPEWVEEHTILLPPASALGENHWDEV